MGVKSNLLAFLAFFFHIDRILTQAAANSTSNSKAASTASLCNVPLLNQLRLSGAPAGKAVAIPSCKINATDSCCSAIDEIKAIKSYNMFTLPKLKKHTEDIKTMLNRIAEIVPFVQTLDPDTINFHHDDVAWRKTNETQCFNGNFFVEETGYDIVKNRIGLSRKIVSDFADKVAAQLTDGKPPLVTRQAVTNAIGSVFTSSVSWDFCLLFNTQYLDAWVTKQAATVTTLLASMAPPLVNLGLVPAGQQPSAYLEQALGISAAFVSVARSIASMYYLQTIQQQAAKIHVIGLLGYIDSLTSTLTTTYKVPNVIPLIDRIKDELFADIQLRRYISWFILPSSVNNFTQMSNYVRNRIIKVISGAVLSMPTITNATHYLTMNQVMRAMGEMPIATRISNNLCMIGAAWAAQYRLPRVVEAVWKTGSLPKEDFYLLLARQTFQFPDVSSLRNWNPTSSCMTVNSVKATYTRILAAVANNVTFTTTLPSNFTYDSDAARAELLKLSQTVATYSEMSANGKQVCVVVKRHQLIREAVFNPRKFAFCRSAVGYFQTLNISSVVQNLPTFQIQMAELTDLKKGLYCAACSKSNGRFVDLSSQSISFSNQFCLDIVKRYQALFRWRSQEFSNYMNTLYQHLKCFEPGAPLNMTYPYPDDGGIVPPPLPDLDACLKVTSPADIGPCLGFCSFFTVGSFSKVFDSDLQQLRNLYNFIINILRVSGRRFGQMPTSSKGRLLEEEPEWVKSFAPATGTRRKHSRRLQNAANATANATINSTANGSVSAANGTRTNSSSSPSSNASGNSTSVPVSGEATIALYLFLAQNLDKMRQYTRAAHYNHDELTMRKINYIPMPLANLVRDLRPTFRPAGINLLSMYSDIDFNIMSLQGIAQRSGGSGYERLDPYAIRDCVLVQKKDLESFTKDLQITVSPALPKFTPASRMKIDRHTDFVLYKPDSGNLYRKRKLRAWKTIKKQAPQRALKLKSTGQQKKVHEEPKRNSITNFLFKLLF